LRERFHEVSEIGGGARAAPLSRRRRHRRQPLGVREARGERFGQGFGGESALGDHFSRAGLAEGAGVVGLVSSIAAA
jgi:hypothetical protein